MRTVAVLILALALAGASQALGFKPVHLTITGNGANKASYVYITTAPKPGSEPVTHPEVEVALDYETTLRLDSGTSVVVVAQGLSEAGSITVNLATEGVRPKEASATSSGPYGVAKVRFVVP